MDNNNRLFIGCFPICIVYADRQQEEHGDYKTLATLSYATLELKIRHDCPTGLRKLIKADAAKIQTKRGQDYPITTAGQTVRLGGDQSTFQNIKASPARSVADFLEHYYKPDRYHGRGADYAKCVLASHISDYERQGWTIISHHDSAIGRVVIWRGRGVA